MIQVACTLVAALALAQPGDSAKDVIEIQTRKFAFPLAWDAQKKSDIRQVRLFVSEDRGTTWRHVSDHMAGDDRAPYTAERDGECWFALQVQRTDGTLEPAGIDRLAAAMKVRVRTDVRISKAAPAESIAKTSPSTLALAETLAAKGYVAVPLEKMRTGYLGVRIRIGDKTLFMLLDTGAPNSHGDPERTKALGLEWRYLDENEFGPGWGKVGYCYLTAPKIGSVDIGRMQMRSKDETQLNAILREYGDAPVDGLLGADVLEPHAAVIDYATRTLFLRPIDKK
jgi:hypothetical protein